MKSFGLLAALLILASGCATPPSKRLELARSENTVWERMNAETPPKREMPSWLRLGEGVPWMPWTWWRPTNWSSDEYSRVSPYRLRH